MKHCTDREILGKTIRASRLSLGWTQEELAARAGLHPTYIGSVERGERNLGAPRRLAWIFLVAIKPLRFRGKMIWGHFGSHTLNKEND